jgi:hypothetical protein
MKEGEMGLMGGGWLYHDCNKSEDIFLHGRM